MGEKTATLTRWVNIIAFVFTVTINGLAGGTTLIGGKVTAEVSDSNPTLITPAGYVFSIWGIIYVLLGIFVVYQALPRNRGKDFQKKIGWLFTLSSIANIVWIFLWQLEYLVFSVVLIFFLLATLILIYLRLDIGRSKVAIGEKLAVHLPFSVYLGWITIASIANVAVALVSLKWNGFGISSETWAIVVIIVALLITLIVLATRRDMAYSLVIIWALIGIAAKQSVNQTIVMITEICAVLIAIAAIASIIIYRLRNK
jgi:benzodiazapine receptor